MSDPWGYWKSEIARIERGGATLPDDRQGNESASIQGYWRVQASKMKHDWPVLIWREPDELKNPQRLFSIQWGAGRPKIMTDAEVLEFTESTFLRCQAVRRIDWTAAVERGAWADGKIARPTSAEERLDIIPSTPAGEGGNAVDENGDPIDSEWEQIKAKLEKQIERARELGPVNTKEQAEAAANIRETILGLGKLGEVKRKTEKKPFDDGAAKVQAKYVPTLEPASAIAKALLDAIDRWQRAEQARLVAEQRAREAAERKRLAEEEAARLAAEQPTKSQEEIAAEAAAAAEEAMAQAPAVEIAKPVVQGSNFSRAQSKAKRKTGVITDVDAFIAAIKEQADFKEWLQGKANSLARANTALPGMEIDNG